MAESESWLGDGSTDSAEVARYYDEWAPTYDNSLQEWEYKAPEYAAGLLKKYLDRTGPIFDAGCGTGLTGRALRSAGFEPVIGTDISSASVKQAQDIGAYGEVSVLDLQRHPLPFKDDRFAAVNCVGVLTYIEDPGRLLREFVRVTSPGGMVVFTHRDDLIEKQDFHSLVDKIEQDGLWTKVFVSEPSPYLPRNDEFADMIHVVYFACRVTELR
jgi:predicted TPR repeat methyltransferase